MMQVNHILQVSNPKANACAAKSNDGLCQLASALCSVGDNAELNWQAWKARL